MTTKKNKKEDKEIIKKKSPKTSIKKNKSIDLRSDSEIALDFATVVYKKFNKIIKSVILFGSTVKQKTSTGSDIDIIIIVDDVSIRWDMELIAWYREELDKILRNHPYKKGLHINTIKLSTWWDDLMRGDPLIINVLRYGEAVIDFAGFFAPLKFLLINGKIKSTPEAIQSCIERAPQHLLRSKAAELNSIEGLFWAMVDSAHAALISEGVLPPSPEYIVKNLNETFVSSGRIKSKYSEWYRDLFILHKKITHREINELKGVEIDKLRDRVEEFLRVMMNLVKENIEKKTKEDQNKKQKKSEEESKFKKENPDKKIKKSFFGF